VHKPKQKRVAAALALWAMVAGELQAIPHAYATDVRDNDSVPDSRDERRLRTVTPIEHLIIVIPENRSYDHTFGTYRPRHDQFVSNLLSKGIVRADGTSGPNFAAGAQFTVPPQPDFYIGAPIKTLYAVLPAPDTLGTPSAPRDTAPPFTSLQIAAIERDLDTADLVLLTTGASGLPARSVDTRVSNAANLPNGPFQLTGPTMPYDAYTGDTIHRFFQMWQQSDCSLVNATPHNPSGCLNDLYP
jgi:phospholipase C